jgi:hypothetical protein
MGVPEEDRTSQCSTMPDACCWTASIRTCLRCRQKRCRPKSEIAWDHMRIHPNSLRSPSVSRLLPYYAARWLFDTLNLVATAFLALGGYTIAMAGSSPCHSRNKERCPGYCQHCCLVASLVDYRHYTSGRAVHIPCVVARSDPGSHLCIARLGVVV